MGLREGDCVMVAMIIEARSLKTVEVTAASEKDWEMLVSEGLMSCCGAKIVYFFLFLASEQRANSGHLTRSDEGRNEGTESGCLDQ